MIYIQDFIIAVRSEVTVSLRNIVYLKQKSKLDTHYNNVRCML